MLEAHNLDLEFMTPEMKDILGKLGLDSTKSQLDQNFYFDDNEDPKRKRIKKTRAGQTPYLSTKVQEIFWVI